MPSNTFLNLPEDKQTRLMDAASWEFSAKPFNEVSINKIIQDAGIPRGSFYMYFQDKEDLFRYLVHGYVEQLLMVLEELLLRERGDIFAALRLLFDYVWEKREEQALGGMGAMSAIISRNGGMQRGALLDLLDSGAVLERLRPGGVLISDNVLQEGDILQSRFAVERRDRTIHSRMRGYLSRLKRMEELETAIVPIGDGVTVSVKKCKGSWIDRDRHLWT